MIEDKCSGTTPFFDRPGGKKIQQLVNKGLVSELSCWQIDRLGRSLMDILNTVNYFTQKSICVHFFSQGLRTIDEDGKENPVTKMVISMLAVVAEMEKNQIRERQLEGVALAKARGVYQGRKPGSSEDVLKFLSKPKNAKALAYLKMGLSNTEISKLVGLHINTITKIKKLGMQQRTLKAA